MGFGDGFRLLVVDDDESVRGVLADVLSESGFAVDAVADLRTARARVDRRSYDLLVIDKNLPDGSGLELARYLGEREADCEMILITGQGTKEAAFEAFEIGLSDVIPKPFEDIDDVCVRIKKALERLGATRRARSSRFTAPAAPAGFAGPTSESERRLRFFVELRVRFILVDGSLTGAAFVSQLSTTDLFVESDRPLPLGTCVRMRLYLPRTGAVDVHGVVRRHGDGKSMLGMRIEFTGLTAAQSESIRAHLAPRRRTLAMTEAPRFEPPAEESDLGNRFTPDALRLFVDMHGGKVLDFIETLDTATVEAILDEGRRSVPEMSAGPGKTPAPFESIPPALFHPENANPEDLPLVMGSTPAQPTEPTDEEDRLRAKYRLSEELLDDSVRRKYSIDDSLFDDDKPARKAPAEPVPGQTPSGEVLNKIGANPDQRRAFAVELRRRADEALARGLVFKAASDLALAVAFDPGNLDLQAMYERVREQSNQARGEDLYRQGLQQMALGDAEAASKLLRSACELELQTKYAIAAVRVLLHIATEEAETDCRTLLRDAIARDPDSADLHVLNGKVAERAGFAKAAQRAYQRALELNPDHETAKELLARLT